jgi:hypothetical protein
MDANQQLIRWNARWGLTGDVVACTRCMGHQNAIDGDKAFVHLPGCERVADGLYPWGTLRDILNVVVDGQ